MSASWFGCLLGLGTGAFLVATSARFHELLEVGSASLSRVEMRLVRLRIPLGRRQLLYCGGGLLLLTGTLLLFGAWELALVIAFTGVFLPFAALRRLEEARRAKLDCQIAGFLDALIRNLGAAPDLFEAIVQARQLVDAPLSEELEQACSEVRLGTTLEAALERLGERSRCSNLSVALLTLRVSQTTGGDLPSVLRATAESLREMGRLDELLRTKTSEGRLQTWVISAVPIPLLGLIRVLDAEFFLPLETTWKGRALCGVALVLWVGAILLARKILEVDY